MENDGYPGLFYLEGHKAYEFEMKRTLENFTHFLDNDLSLAFCSTIRTMSKPI